MKDLTLRDNYIGTPKKWMEKAGYRDSNYRPRREWIFSLTIRIPNPFYRLYWKKVEASRERTRQRIINA